MEKTWPRLRVADWTETRDTLHMWTQIVGKVRMAYAPAANHWWHVTLYPTARGLTTSSVPYDKGVFDIEFDFVGERLRLRTSDGGSREVVLEPKTVATFYGETLEALAALGLEPSIHPVPNEVATAIPFAENHRHGSYDGEAAEFVGKASPVHFFWGAMDLAYTRFSGREAPRHPGGVPNCPPSVMHEGYSHELASFGFWPGGGAEGAFYAYAYPEPPGYRERTKAFFDNDLQECVLPYERVADAADPDAELLEFLRATYAAAADLAGWDRSAAEA